MLKPAAIKIILALTLTLTLTLTLITSLYAAPQMADYCYLPPFVTDPNTPPNIMIVFERSSNVMKRAYSTTYNSGNTYYGFLIRARVFTISMIQQAMMHLRNHQLCVRRRPLTLAVFQEMFLTGL